MTRVLLLPADEAGCGLYRMRLPAAAAAAQGVDVVFGTGLDIITDGDRVRSVLTPDDVDVVVIQRPLDWRWAQAIPHLQAKGIGCVVDVDDRFDAIHPANPAYMASHPRVSPASNFQHLTAACRAADLVTVSTPALADVYGAHGRVVVLENCVPAEILERPVSPQDGFGWAGAAAFHPDDLRVVGAAVARVVRDGWSFRVVGPPEGVGRQLGLRDGEFEACGWVPVHQWLDTYSTLATAIAPLADTAFNQAKSFLKPLEAMAAGVPVICSPTAEYRRLVDQGAGVLAAKPKDWERALRRAHRDEGWRAEQVEAGRGVAARWTYEAHGWRWAEVWEMVAAHRRGSLPPPHLTPTHDVLQYRSWRWNRPTAPTPPPSTSTISAT